eukprot:gene23078-30270_t
MLASKAPTGVCRNKRECTPAFAASHLIASVVNTRLAHNAASCRAEKVSLIVTHSLTKRAEDIGGAVVKTSKPTPRTTLRMGLPSKGRMAEDTKDSALSVYKPNPRQYVASIPEIPKLEVWMQRASDVVRKVRTGDLDLGIVGYDMFCELADNDPDVLVVHEALDFGGCKLALGVPMGGKFANITSLDELRVMPEWTASNPLRVVTGYTNVAKRYFAEKGFEHVVLLSADGALEAAPAMGSADIILDLVSTGVTLRENNLKELVGGDIMESEGILIANKNSLLDREGLLQIVHELIERFDAHLKANQFYSVIVNMKGDSPEDVATRLCQMPALKGLEGPTVASVYNLQKSGEQAECKGTFAATICVRKKKLYKAVKALQQLGGSGVLVQPMTYIFDEEPDRWVSLLEKLGLKAEDIGGRPGPSGRAVGCLDACDLAWSAAA